MICDFCSSPSVVVEFPCEDITYRIAGDERPFTSLSAWMACAECARLIDGEHYEALARRSLALAPPARDLEALIGTDQALFFLRSAHRAFQQSRTGPAKLVAEAPRT